MNSCSLTSPATVWHCSRGFHFCEPALFTWACYCTYGPTYIFFFSALFFSPSLTRRGRSAPTVLSSNSTGRPARADDTTVPDGSDDEASELMHMHADAASGRTYGGDPEFLPVPAG